jgi:hypothetical protein
MFDQNRSPFVVDQKGPSWFFLALLPCLLLASAFRIFFSEVKITTELKKAFSKLEPELKLNFQGARLSLDSGFFYPKIALEIFEMKGFYTISSQNPYELSFHTDEIRIPLSLFELFSGRLQLDRVDIENLFVQLDQSPFHYQKILKKKTSAQESFNSPSSRVHFLKPYSSDASQSKKKKSSRNPQYQPSTVLVDIDEMLPENLLLKMSFYRPETSKPIERVYVKSFRLGGLWGQSLGLELRHVDLKILKDGRAEGNSQLAFLFDQWGHQPLLPLEVRWNPEDQFISAHLGGRWKEGQVDLTLIVDPLQNFFSVEGLARSLPTKSFFHFMKSLYHKNLKWMNSFLWPDLLEAPLGGWVSFDLSLIGYLDPNKPSQMTVRNFSIEDQSQKIEVSRMSQSVDLSIKQNLKQGHQGDPFQVSLHRINQKLFQSLFSFHSLSSVLSPETEISGLVEIPWRKNYVGENLSLEKSRLVIKKEIELDLSESLFSFHSQNTHYNFSVTKDKGVMIQEQKSLGAFQGLRLFRSENLQAKEKNQTEMFLEFEMIEKDILEAETLEAETLEVETLEVETTKAQVVEEEVPGVREKERAETTRAIPSLLKEKMFRLKIDWENNRVTLHRWESPHRLLKIRLLSSEEEDLFKKVYDLFFIKKEKQFQLSLKGLSNKKTFIKWKLMDLYLSQVQII